MVTRDPKKQATVLRVRLTMREKIAKAHSAYIGKTSKVISLTEFLDLLLEEGIQALSAKS